MKWLLLLTIRAYWVIWPTQWKRKCLFKESCSRYVYRITLTSGMTSGIKALIRRSRVCRPGYKIHATKGNLSIQFPDGTEIPEFDIASGILYLFYQAAKLLENDLNEGVKE